MKKNCFLDERVLYIDNKIILSYSKGYIIYREQNTEKKQMCKVGKKTLYNVPIIERVMRNEPRCAARVDATHIIISYNGEIINYDCRNNVCVVEHRFERGMNNPLSFLAVFNKDTNSNDVYYGEYIWNKEKGPVAIYKRDCNGWKKKYEFPPNSILHIHNIFNDKYRKGFIILTGDSDNESGIWISDYDFENVRPIIIGKQQYRACVVFPTQTGIYFATDTPLEENYIYFLELDENGVAKSLKREYQIPGPCIYGTNIEEEFYFSTSVEPDSTLPKWRYRVTNKLGRGVIDRSTHIIKKDKKGNYIELISIKKDILPIWLFQFGNIIFPYNDGKKAYAVLQSTKEGHGITIEL